MCSTSSPVTAFLTALPIPPAIFFSFAVGVAPLTKSLRCCECCLAVALSDLEAALVAVSYTHLTLPTKA